MRIDEIENDKGDCYQKAWQQITSMNQKEAKNVKLVHGEVVGTGEFLGRHFGHAWLEKTVEFEVMKGRTITIVMVNDCSNKRNIELPKDVYYRLGKIVDEPGKLFHYTADEANKIGNKFGHYGAWELDIEKD